MMRTKWGGGELRAFDISPKRREDTNSCIRTWLLHPDCLVGQTCTWRWNSSQWVAMRSPERFPLPVVLVFFKKQWYNYRPSYNKAIKKRKSSVVDAVYNVEHRHKYQLTLGTVSFSPTRRSSDSRLHQCKRNWEKVWLWYHEQPCIKSENVVLSQRLLFVEPTSR